MQILSILPYSRNLFLKSLPYSAGLSDFRFQVLLQQWPIPLMPSSTETPYQRDKVFFDANNHRGVNLDISTDAGFSQIHYQILELVQVISFKGKHKVFIMNSK